MDEWIDEWTDKSMLLSVQQKLSTIDKENYELRKELSKQTGVSPNAIRPGQVRKTP